MTYITDTKWLESKQLAKANGFANNWLEVVEYYHTIGGHKAMVHVVINEKQMELWHILDDETVLLVDSHNIVHVKSYDEVMESRKLFFYSRTNSYTEKVIVLPEGKTYNGESSITIKVV